MRTWFLLFVCCFAMLQAQDDPEMDDLLNMSLDELLNISVTTASKSAGSISDSPAIISVITREEILNLGVETLGELLNLTPGFESNRAVMFGVHDSVGVRGRMTDFGEDVLILLDGQRLNDAFTGGGTNQVKYLNVAGIQRVELIRGPGSTLYGSNAFVGIVNVITLKDSDAATPALTLTTGNLGKQRGIFQYGDDGSDYHWSIRADFSSDDGADYQMGKGYLRPPVALPSISDPVESSFDLGLRLRAGGLTLSLDHFTRQLDGFMPWGFLDGAWDSEILDTNRDDTKVTRAMMSYEKELGSWQFTPSVRYLDGQIRQLYFLAAPGVPPFSQGTSVAEYGWVGSPNHDTRTSEYELQINRVFAKHDLVAGLFHATEEVTGVWNRFNFFPFPSDLPQTDYGTEVHWFDGAESYADPTKREVNAIYVQDTWKPTKELGVTAGIRRDDYSDFGSSTNPRLGLVYKPSEKFHMKALYGQAFRAPTFNELYVRNNPVQRGNADLEAQTIETLELFFSYTFSKQMVGSFSVYKNTYKDLIHLEQIQPFPTYFNAEQDEEDVGFEAEFKYKRDRYKYLFANYSYIDPRDTDDEHRAFIARQKISIVGNYDVAGRVIANVSAFYRGERVNPTADPDYEIKNHWVWNAALRAPKLWKGMEASLSAQDLGDEQWKSPGFSYVLTPENVPNRGLKFTASLSWEF